MNIPRDRIIVAHLLDKNGDQGTRGWSEKVEIAYSDDYFKTKTVVLEHGNKFLITRGFFFAAQVVEEGTKRVRFLDGHPFLQKNDIQLIKINYIQSHELYYTILDTSEGQVFLHINNEGNQSKYGNIYASNSTGRSFALSLQNNVRNWNGQCDFTEVAGVKGIFLANVYDDVVINKTKGEYSGNSQELDEFKRTVVSFDQGGTWETLQAPKFNSMGDNIECEKEEGCRLHLYSGRNRQFTPIHLTKNSMGIVLGVGNVGRYLSFRRMRSIPISRETEGLIGMR